MGKIGFLILCAILAVTMAGCGGGSGSGSGTLQLFLTDAPMDADEINVKITSIDVHKADGGWTTVKTYSPALEVNLMDYQALFEFDGDPLTEAQLLLLDAPLTPGHYTMVRLQFESVSCVIDGQTFDVDLQNVAQTGLKLNHEFDVAPGEASALLLDFDGKNSIVSTGQGSYKLQPVVSMVPKVVSGTIRGVVTFKDASDVTVPVPEGASVEIFKAGTTTSAGSPGVISTADGSFAVGALLPDTYDIKVNATGYAADTVRLAGVVLGVAETKDVGEIIVTLP
ncbi:MAG: DUF4382 domain-containing protein [Armatimonadota bacterium]|nr:DUF4382 domain-containing protein [Armatimonadota bacterium]